jgi:hypothetical protein
VALYPRRYLANPTTTIIIQVPTDAREIIIISPDLLACRRRSSTILAFSYFVHIYPRWRDLLTLGSPHQ